MKFIVLILAASLAVVTADAYPGESSDPYAYSEQPEDDLQAYPTDPYSDSYGYSDQEGQVGSEVSDPLASADPAADPFLGFRFRRPYRYYGYRRPFGYYGYRRPFGYYGYRRPFGYYGYRRPYYGYRRRFFG